MARFRRLETLNAIVESGLVPVLYHPDPEVVAGAARACHRGGARCFEFTHRGDLAHRVFEQVLGQLASDCPGLIVGAGSIGDPYTAGLYLAAGASFVVGPVLDAGVARLCNRRKVPYSPGCGSATEVAAAEELGCEIVKIFPGDAAGGPGFVKALLGPCPWSSLMPTGGVEATAESVRAWIQAGAAALGMGSNLLSRDLVAARDWKRIEERVRSVLAWIRQSREAMAR